MGMTRGEAAALLGAWAVDAVDADERRAIDAVLATEADLDRRARAMAAAAAQLGAGVAAPPPPSLRSDLVAAARASRVSAPASTPLEVYEHQAAALASLLADLRPDEWASAASPYRWDVHGLVAHLVAIERLMESTLGLGPAPDGATAGHLDVGVELVERLRQGDPAATVAAWDAAVERIVAHLHSPGAPDDDLDTPFHGWPFHLGSLLVARGFELWTHADDVRRATGRPLGSPIDEDLRTMSDHSVRSLELIQPFLPEAPALVPLRVVLTGSGGGTWDLGPAGDEPAVLVADVVDYCRLASQRIEPDELTVTVEPGTGGEIAPLVSSLLVAARAFAV